MKRKQLDCSTLSVPIFPLKQDLRHRESFKPSSPTPAESPGAWVTLGPHHRCPPLCTPLGLPLQQSRCSPNKGGLRANKQWPRCGRGRRAPSQSNCVHNPSPWQSEAGPRSDPQPLPGRRCRQSRIQAGKGFPGTPGCSLHMGSGPRTAAASTLPALGTAAQGARLVGQAHGVPLHQLPFF